MNQTFNIHRFALVVKLDFIERGKYYLLIALLLLILLLAMMLPIVTSSEPAGFYEALHYMALFMVLLFATSFYTSNAMTHYASSPTSISSLMLPASRLEKFMSVMLYNLLFIVPFLILFFQLHLKTVEIANAKLPDNGYKYGTLPWGYVVYTCFAYFMMHSVILLGSIYFSKRSYVKTAAFMVAAIVFYIALHIVLSRHFTHYPSKLNTLPLAGWRIWYYDPREFLVHNGMNAFHIKFPENIEYIIQVFTGLMILGFWYAAYLRLKEKEV